MWRRRLYPDHGKKDGILNRAGLDKAGKHCRRFGTGSGKTGGDIALLGIPRAEQTVITAGRLLLFYFCRMCRQARGIRRISHLLAAGRRSRDSRTMVADRRAHLSPCLANAQTDNCRNQQRDKERSEVQFHTLF